MGDNNISDLPKKEQEAFEKLVDELPLGILSCDREGNITAVNDFLFKILGSPSTKATKKVNILTFPALVESGISETVKEALKTGRNISTESAYRSAWGKELFLSFRIFPLKNENGDISGCHAIVEDLTNERKASNDIENSKLKDRLIEHISNRFINSSFKEIDRNINLTLEDLGNFIGAERAVLFSVVEYTDHLIKTHEWHIEGIRSRIALNEKIDSKKLFFEQLMNLEPIGISDVEKLPEDKDNIQQIFQNLKIRSVAIAPIFHDGIFKGFLGVDFTSKTHTWNEKELYLLKIVGDIIVNILERKNSEVLLLKREQEFEEIIESLNAVVWKGTFDIDGNLISTYIARSVDKILGLPEGTIGTDWNKYFAHIHHEDLPKVHNAFEKAFLQPGIPVEMDYRLKVNDDKIFWIYSTGTAYLQNDGTILTYGTSVNITERKRSEGKLKESEALLSEVGRIGKIGGWSIDLISGEETLTDEILKINEDYEIRSLKDGLQRFAPNSREILEKAINNAIEKHKPYDLELEIISAKGTHKWVRTIAHPEVKDGRTVKLHGTMQDITERKKAEDELKHKEEKYRSLFEQSNDAIFLNHVDGQIVDVNEKACEMFGYTNEQFKKMNVVDLLAPHHKNTDKLGIHQFREDGGVDVHVLYAKSNGETFDAEVNAKVLEGTPDLAQSIVRDISKHKEAEEKLRESEEKFRLFIEHAPVSLAMFDRDMRHIAVSQLWLDEFSPDKRDIIGLNHYDIYPWVPEDFREAHRRGMQGEVVHKDENMFVQDDGSIRWTHWEVRPWKTTKGDIGGIIIFSEDITKRKEADIAIKESETKYRNLFERSNDAIIIHDFDGNIVDVNSKTCEILGYTEEELKHRPLIDFFPPEDKEYVLKGIAETKSKGTSRHDAKLIKSNGKIIYMDLSASLIRTQDKLVQIVGRDITDRVRAEAAMISAKIEAETASRTKSEFLANMSHELRTPLNSIIGFSDIMLDGIAGELVPKQEHYMKHISKSGRHLLSLINDILDISKVEAGKMELHYEIIDVKPMIDEIVTMTQTLTFKKNITVDVIIPDDIPKVEADRSKIKQILYNLMGNAIKFTTDNGRITFRTAIKGHELQISVIDTGIGISPDDQKIIFKPFSQIDSSTSRKYSGTGLGLALVKELVELHRGRIWVESEIGKGSVFTFGLPIIDEGTN